MNERRPGVEAQPLLAPVAAALARLRRLTVSEWRQSHIYRWTLRTRQVEGLAAAPSDYRPADPKMARSILSGRMTLAGETLEIGQGGDPWDTASPSRAFAVSLHRFDWLPGLVHPTDPRLGQKALEEALRLSLDWIELFEPITPFAWGAETLERRVFNLACAAHKLVEIASEDEQRRLLESLAEQGRSLLRMNDGPARAAERAVVSALVGATLAGKPGRTLLKRGLALTERTLRAVVSADGGLRTRSPEQGLELLLDLLSLDSVLQQRRIAAPDAVTRAIDRMTAAVRFFTLGDGRLGAFQGGESADPARVASAVAQGDASGPVYSFSPQSGYHRMSGRLVQLLVDAAPAAAGPWSIAACAQPVALEISCGGDRMIVNAGWSPGARGPQALRLTSAGSTASVGEESAGAPLSGFLAAGLGPRLSGGARRVDVRRNENETGVWLELIHDGWAARYGLLHQRRLYLDFRSDELRGEDLFMPSHKPPARRRRLDPFTLHFHLHQDVQASLARDRRSVLIRGASNRGWWFRNDAPEVSLEPSIRFDAGVPQRTRQIALRGNIGLEGSARVRWKLAPVDSAEQPPPVR
jgi:uncharacterized heparinase superfamily protein